MSDVYIQRASAKKLEDDIRKAWEFQDTLSIWINNNKESNTQTFLAQILVESMSISLSIGELLPRGYLLSSEALLRTLLDRVSIANYILIDGNKALKKWESNQMPSLAKRVRLISNLFSDDEFENLIKPHVDKLHKAVHSSPVYADANAGIWNGRISFISGPDFSRPEKHDSLSGLVSLYLGLMNLIIEAGFPKLADNCSS